ncbi:unnamed protein product [Coffea canephora]|uniref:Leucine-rich repeat-containing N-terminal plant-type domain-containing protein n=1 Tax=Coffea canephora TaxID=49390 RepID=A0A068UND1_COFCA|nr:unnamed protein product [Coffea canephora]
MIKFTPFIVLWFTIGFDFHVRAYSNVSCFESEQKTLHEFKEGLIDKSNHLASWTGENCCSWEGVGCNRNIQHVVKLDLRNNATFDSNRFWYGDTQNYVSIYGKTCLGGQISPSLVNLQHWHYLDLKVNHYYLSTKSLWWITSLSSLKHLDLSKVDLGERLETGCKQLTNFTSLTSFDLEGSEFNSTIPLWLFNLTSLHWTSLSYLDLSYNQFNISLPDPLFTLNNLVYMDITFNQIQGPLPFGLGNLTSLSILHMISRNKLNSSRPEYKQVMSSSHEFKSGVNKLGNSSFTSRLPNLPDCSRAGLEQEVQRGLSSAITDLHSCIHMSNPTNEFEGKIPSAIGQLRELTELDLNSNGFNGTIPSSKCDATLLALNVNDLSDNHFNGSIPDSLCSLQMLVLLDLSNNQLSGRIPSCIGKLKTLGVLNLANNSLYGHIPISLGHLNDLQSLHLNRNKFTGMVPFSCRHLKNLQYLDLGNNELEGIIPAWIGEELSLLKM